MTTDNDTARLRALCARLMAGEGELTQAEINETLALITGPRSATKALGAVHKRMFNKAPPRRRVRRGIGSY